MPPRVPATGPDRGAQIRQVRRASKEGWKELGQCTTAGRKIRKSFETKSVPPEGCLPGPREPPPPIDTELYIPRVSQAFLASSRALHRLALGSVGAPCPALCCPVLPCAVYMC